METTSISRRIVEALKSIDWRGLRVLFAVVHGSALRSDNPRDVDVLVAPAPGFGEDEEVAIMEAVEKATGLPADLHVVDLSDPECPLLLEALEKGVVVYVDEGRGLEELVRVSLLCWDYTLMKRKVGFTRLIARSVAGRDGSRGAVGARG